MNLRALAARLKPEALLFDIDGVLLDVRASYLQAVELAAARALKRHARPAPPAPGAIVARLKKVPGWNNDWDCAYGLVLIGLVANGPDEFARIFTALEAAGQTLPQLEATLIPLLAQPDRYDKALIWRDFQGHYLGREALKALYGAEADFDAEPLHAGEPVRVSGATLARLGDRYRVGAYTGRSPEEAALAFRRLGFTPERIVADDGRFRKPDPGGLVELLRGFNATRALYFGDSVDDARAVAALPGEFEVALVAVGDPLPGMALRLAPEALEEALGELPPEGR